MRTHLITLAAFLSLAGLVAASTASAGGGSSGGGTSAGGGSSGGSGCGGHGGGGGGGAHGGGGSGGGSHLGGGYAAHGGPEHPHKHPHCYREGGDCSSTSQLPLPDTLCPPRPPAEDNNGVLGCQPPIKAKAPAR